MLGTHNTMTYLKAQKWYMRPFQFAAKCQEVSLKSQYELGARMFDLRVYFDSKDRPMFKHGKMKYSGNVHAAFDFINSHPGCYVRLILEQDRKDKDKTKVFCKFCKYVLDKYKNILFFGGYRKFDWCHVYDFERDINYVQPVSSMDDKKINDLFPKAYAKRHNKAFMAEHNPQSENILIDYINIDVVS